MATGRQHRPAYKKLCKALREMREKANLTQRDLGKALGIHNTMIHRTEIGDRRIDPLEFAQWCAACKSDPGEVLKRFV